MEGTTTPGDVIGANGAFSTGGFTMAQLRDGSSGTVAMSEQLLGTSSGDQASALPIPSDTGRAIATVGVDAADRRELPGRWTWLAAG